jgi:hypothetical protein
MQSLPKIVSERLRATPCVGDRPDIEHPDADVLNAFAERSLSDSERVTILDHLARCHDCRDIVALALPETEAGQLVIRPVRGGWLAWPGLRWGVAAAAVIVVVSIGALQYQRQARSSVMIAKDSDHPVMSLDSQAQSQERANSAAASEPKEKALSDKASAALAPANHAHTASAKTKTVPVLNIPPNIPTAAANGASRVPMLETSQSAGEANTVAQNQIAPSAHLFDEGSSHEIVRAKDAIPAAGDAVANVPANGRNFVGLVSVAPGTSPGWAINSAGGLQRTYDQGTTWQDVNVAANLMPSVAKGYVFDTSAQPTVAGESAAKSKESNKKVTAEAPASAATPVSVPGLPALVFRAVAATGADVWAGGSGGALYHSLDAGDHWAQVSPAVAGANLTGDIVNLEFSDSLHGKVTTSTSETLVTTDGGQTWQKQ